LSHGFEDANGGIKMFGRKVNPNCVRMGTYWCVENSGQPQGTLLSLAQITSEPDEGGFFDCRMLPLDPFGKKILPGAGEPMESTRHIGQIVDSVSAKQVIGLIASRAAA
jgi:hypothetical protein